MTISAESQQRIEAYLRALRKGLRTLPEDDARDVVEEIRSHILDKAVVAGDITSDKVSSALLALGSPEHLASQYVTDDLLSRAQGSRSPWLLLKSLFRWASLSIAGFMVLMFSVIGYFLAGAFALCALLKPIHPRTAGLWALSDATDLSLSLRLGFGPAPAHGRELLGWWIIPIGLVLGIGVVFLTFNFGLWSIRKLWRPRRLV